MPKKSFKAKSKSKSKKRTFKKSSKRPLQKSIVDFGLAFPAKAKMTHKYHENFTMTVAAGGGIQTNYTFSANGMYDPNITGTGHQPFCFDQMAAVYNHYVVIASKITIRCGQYSTANSPMYVSIIYNDDSTVTPSFDTMAEQGNSISIALGAAQTEMRSLSLKYSAKKVFGGGLLANNGLQGSTTTNPTEASNYTVSLFSPSGAGGTIQCEAFIEYIAIWTELKDIAGS